MSKKRAAAFFYSPRPKAGFVPVPVGAGLVGYVRGALTPKGTTLVGVLDWAHTSLPGASGRYPEDECFMNGHFVFSRKVKQDPPATVEQVMGYYDLSDRDWDATPEPVQRALVKSMEEA